MQDRETLDFYIDYHEADLQWAEWIAYQLRNAHYTVFDPKQDIRPGMNQVVKIDEVLQKGVHVILLLSPDYLGKAPTDTILSGGSIWSAKFAEGLLLPVRVRNCQIRGLLSSIQLIDLAGLSEGDARITLLDGLSAERKPPTGAPDFPGSPVRQTGARRTYRYPGTLPSLWNVPVRNNIFTDRDHPLTKLDEIFKEVQNGQVLTHVIKGLGGIGKTQVAIEYAYRYNHRYDAVFWIDGSNEQTFAKDLVTIEQLLIEEGQIGTKTTRISGSHHLVDSRLVVKQWLQSLSSDMRWLLILDNIADFALINDFVPSGGNGHILVTARAQATGTMVSSPDSLLALSPEDGALLLLRRTGKIGPRAQLHDFSQADLGIAQKLSHLMGSLPLALDQAGAYVESTGSELQSYLEYYNDSNLRRELLESRGEPNMYHPDPVATTWNEAFERIRAFKPIAYSLLLLCSFLHHEAIPEEVLARGAGALPIFQALAHSPLQVDAAYAELRKYSLLIKESQSRTFFIHPMVQVVLRDSLSENERRQWAERAIIAMYIGLQVAGQDAQLFHYGPRYFFHVQSGLHAMKTWNIASDESAHLLFLMGAYLHDHAQNSSVGTTVELSADVITKALEDYASRLQEMRRMQEAEQLVAFADRIRVISIPNR